VLVVRAWSWLGFGSDFGFRMLGFLTGLLDLGAMWLAARSLKLKFPLFLLVFAALNPLFIIYGDSMRAWGWGLGWLTLEFAMLWRVLESPTRWRVALAILAGIAAVQSTYYNSVLLFVFCSAGMIVAMRRSQWRTALLMPGICAVAGLTMLPYVNFFRSNVDRYSFVRQPFQVRDFIDKLLDAMSGQEPFGQELLDLRVWWILLMLAAVLVVAWQFLPKKLGVPDRQKDLLLFAGIIMVLSVPAYFMFLHELKFVTSPWYYLSLIMAGALGLETIFSVAENWERGRLFRLVTVVIILVVAVPPVFPVVKVRMTNIDLAAKHLNNVAAKNDLIVVNPYNWVVSFERDYSGAAPCFSLPAIKGRLQRYDLLKELLLRHDRKAVIQDVLNDAQRTLQAGGRVWIVSRAGFSIGGFHSEPAPPAYSANPGLNDQLEVLDYWADAAGYFLQEHSLRHESIAIPGSDNVSKYEKVELMMFSGWRE
jgi:hypothetical protein